MLFPPPVHTPPKTNYPIELKAADLNLALNTTAHYTNDFHVTKLTLNAQLVIRRGQSFLLDLIFYRDYEADKDDLKLAFEIGILFKVI